MIPNSVLRHRVDVRPYVGRTGNNVPTYGPTKRNVRCRFRRKRTTIRTPTGAAVIGTATVEMRPISLPQESLLVFHDVEFTILGEDGDDDLGHDFSVVFIVGSPR